MINQTSRPYLPALCLGLLVLPATGICGVANLKNGLQIEGRMGKIARIGESPDKVTGSTGVTKIVLFDDDLRRVFVSSNQIASVAESEPVTHERIRIRQRVAQGPQTIGGVGPIIRITPFDEWGRRIFTMNTARGSIDVVQGITLITPTYCKVEGLLGGTNSYKWSSRIRTSSIPRQTLSKILMNQIDPKNPDDRLRIVRLYIQAERDKDAQLEVASIIKDFPDIEGMDRLVKELRQSHARRLIKELRTRAKAGQHGLAINMAKNFPVKGVADETLLSVQEILGEFNEQASLGQKTLDLFDKLVVAINDEALKARIKPIREEIGEEIDFDTLNRFASFLRLGEDESLTEQQRLSLAVSGWLLGNGDALENLAVSLDVYTVRNLVRDYLQATRVHERDAILDQLKTLEGSSPSFIAKIVAHMKPPKQTQAEPISPGMYKLSTPGLAGEPDFEYFIQLPPEYNPYRRYSCIVTLNGAGTTPEQQVDWWAGAYNENIKTRTGQATRRGYVVIAPIWTKAHQKKYKYSAREHAAVLYSLRDACQRISIDTDRVFLSGHSMGGDAAWDIGLAHPDLWAGVVPIVATADKYVSRYYENARNAFPMYFVAGELDGDRMQRNKMDLNRYLRYAGYDTIIAEYIGRGHEHFHDEIQELFRWMDLQERDFYPKEFHAVSMRPWDNFFWWVELNDFPDATQVLPLEWPKRAKEAETDASAGENNSLSIRTAASSVTVWLSPEIVDFDERIRITGTGIRSKAHEIQPSVQTRLEAVRSRGDRQNPFWAKVSVK